MDADRKLKILAELDAYSGDYPLMQENDITTSDLAKRYHLTVPLSYMRRVVDAEPDKWEMLQVVDKPGSRRWFWVLRRKV